MSPNENPGPLAGGHGAVTLHVDRTVDNRKALRDQADRRLQRYARLDAELLHAVGDDRFSIGAATSRRRGPMIVPISEIQIGKRLRQLRESTVTELMESISRIGLRTPITVD